MKGKLREFVVRNPIFRKILQAKVAFSFSLRPVFSTFKWLTKSKETTNFTYEIKKWNIDYLASLISNITNVSISKIFEYVKEIENDKELRNHIASMSKSKNSEPDSDNRFLPGRRIGWYVFVRTVKPKVIVETGIDKGLGSCILAAALKKNKEEGYYGFYYGTDINPKAGFLFSGEYKKYGEILVGDSIQSLKNFGKKIDLFVNDSDHNPIYERKEYLAIKDNLSKNAIILSDNSHCTEELFKFSLKTNRHFIFFKEEPKNHWGAGAAIGISFMRNINGKKHEKNKT